MVDLMNLEDQVDLDFTHARRRAWLGRLKTLLLRRATRNTLLSPEEFRRSVPLVEICTWVGEPSRYRR